MRVLDVSDGFSSASAPTAGSASGDSLQVYANDAAYVVANGVATAGDAYINSTDGQVHYYDGAAWIAVPTPASVSVFTNKDIDGGTATDAKRITVPKATLATLNALTRKTGTVVYATDQGKLYYDNGTVLLAVGSGSGGDVNYITNPDAESDTTGYAAYADAASATPEDGTGGSPTVAISRVTSSPLRGNGMFRITKDAANRIGQGTSVDFTIANADKSKVLYVSFEYQPSANFVAGDSSDLRMWVYDVTNSALIQLAPYTIQGGSGATQKFVGCFQAASSSTSYRLLFHVSTTNATAWTFDFDSLTIGPSATLIGAAISDWKSFTPTGTWIANTTYTGQWRRVGGDMEVQVKLTLAGAPTSATLFVNLPSGYAIDTARLAGSTTTNDRLLGMGSGIHSASTGPYLCLYQDTTSVLVAYPSSLAGAMAVVTQAAPFTWANLDVLILTFKVPIVGWDSNVIMSNDASTRVVAMTVLGASGTLTTTVGNNITWGTPSVDTHGAFLSGTYTVPVTGYYKVSGSVGAASSGTFGTGVSVAKNGVATTPAFFGAPNGADSTLCPFSHLAKYNAGDTIQVWGKVSTGTQTVSGSSVWNIERVSGPASIAASEFISARYTDTQTGTIPTSATVFDFSTKDHDTHLAKSGSGTSWKFTAPIAGYYRVNASTGMNGSVVNQFTATIKKNGTAKKTVVTNQPSAGNVTDNLQIADEFYCLAGDYIQAEFYCSFAATFASGQVINITKMDR
jgi:hypothetical protein